MASAAGTSGTGVVITVGRYPNIKFNRVSNLMSVGTTWANTIQTAIIQIEQDLLGVKHYIPHLQVLSYSLLMSQVHQFCLLME